MASADLLVEIGTEELPPKSLFTLSKAFSNNLIKQLQQSELKFNEVKHFATPRRLAVLVTGLADCQPDRLIERRGPSAAAAFDEQGAPTKAAEGFAKSCHTTVDQLERRTTAKGEFLYFQHKQIGKTTEQLVPDIVKQSLQQLPIKKPMRWNNHDFAFVRPVHWLVLLFGNKVIQTTLFGTASSNKTYGHRFQAPQAITLTHPQHYTVELVNQGCVIADFMQRQAMIKELIQRTLPKQTQVIMDNPLLEEVTSLVEWPVPLLGKFDERFLKIPAEVLTLSMKTHQRYFPITDQHRQLLPQFITISNIESKNPQQVINGNERVLHARLSDAEFFYQTDQQVKLSERAEKLKNVVFQEKLGSLYDKTNRVIHLSGHIAKQIGADIDITQRAALLAKADLMTDMVAEFPELQGVMGYYYSQHDGENKQTAIAIKEHYQPRFSGDAIPSSLEGAAIAIADKLDSIVGIFGINQAPTGTKDPFALRRAAIGVIRIIIEKQFDLDIEDLINTAARKFEYLPNEHVPAQTAAFIFERLRQHYLEQNISFDVINTVMDSPWQQRNNKRYNINDLNKRIKAVQNFKNLPEASSLASAQKRTLNILGKYADDVSPFLKPEKLELEAEKALAAAIEKIEVKFNQLEPDDYETKLICLAELKPPVDNFFDQVMVETDDAEKRTNRLALLLKLRRLFLLTADISMLQSIEKQ